MLVVCYVISRSLSAWALAVFPSARRGGMLDNFARAAHKRLVTVSSGLYVLIGAAAWVFFGGWLGVACLSLSLMCIQYYNYMATRYFGGVTGDLAGWFVQVTELLLMAVIVLGGAL